MKRIIMSVTVAALMAAMLAVGGVAWAQGTPQPVDPPPQVDRLRQQGRHGGGRLRQRLSRFEERRDPQPRTVPADAGILVPPGDAAALADALRRVLTDAALRTSLTAAARTAASALPTWDDAVDRFVAELAGIEPALRRSLARA